MKEGRIFTAISSIISEMPAIGKDKDNSIQKYKYRGIESIITVTKPLLIKHGVFITPTILDQQRSERTNDRGTLLFHTLLTIKHTFHCVDGSFIECTTVGEAMDSSDKASNKAMTASLKYALNEVFFIASEDLVDTETEHLEAKQPEKKSITTLSGTSPMGPPDTHLKDLDKPGDHVITVGKKYAGMKIRQLSKEDWEGYSRYLADDAIKTGKSLSKNAQDFIACGNAHFNNPNKPTDIPF